MLEGFGGRWSSRNLLTMRHQFDIFGRTILLFSQKQTLQSHFLVVLWFAMQFVLHRVEVGVEDQDR